MCCLDNERFHSWSLAAPFPSTLASHLLRQAKLEKSCLANCARSHPHGASPVDVDYPIEGTGSKLCRLAFREEIRERFLRIIRPHALREYFILEFYSLL